MFGDINTFLNISTDNLPKGCLFCTDDAESSFIVHHFISLFIKAGSPVVLVSLSQSFGHYHAVGQKLGINLLQARNKGQLVHVDGLELSLKSYSEHPTPADDRQPFSDIKSDDSSSLRAFFHHLKKSVEISSQWDSGIPLIVIDNLNPLLALGASCTAIHAFIQQCVVWVCGPTMNNGCVLPVLNYDENNEINEQLTALRNRLNYLATQLISVSQLPTGYSADVHGCVRWTNFHRDKPGTGNIDTNTMQFKITDRNVSLFARGTSSAVL